MSSLNKVILIGQDSDRFHPLKDNKQYYKKFWIQNISPKKRILKELEIISIQTNLLPQNFRKVFLEQVLQLLTS